jgi:dienelactone hydrolase
MSHVRALVSIATLAAAALAAQAHRAAACTLPAHTNAVKFWPPPGTTPAAGDDRCTPTSSGPQCHLSGYLYKPDIITANMPAIVYVHGSGESKDQEGSCEMVNYFVSRGYVVFAPVVRGVADSTCTKSSCPTPSISNDPWSQRFKNTGLYVSDWIAKPGRSDGSADSDALWSITYLQEEANEDVRAAVSYVAGVAGPTSGSKLVDPDKIALMGHSYGGSTVVFAADLDLDPLPAATIDLSGAVLSWDSSPWWSFHLGNAALARRMPLYLQQSTNESPGSTQDSTLLPFLWADASSLSVGGAQMSVFSRFSIDASFQSMCAGKGYSDAHCAHLFFVSDHSQVLRWARVVEDFLIRYGVD